LLVWPGATDSPCLCTIEAHKRRDEYPLLHIREKEEVDRGKEESNQGAQGGVRSHKGEGWGSLGGSGIRTPRSKKSRKGGGGKGKELTLRRRKPKGLGKKR